MLPSDPAKRHTATIGQAINRRVQSQFTAAVDPGMPVRLPQAAGPPDTLCRLLS